MPHIEQYFKVTSLTDFAHVVTGEHNELRARYSNRDEAQLDARRLNAAYALGKKKRREKSRRLEALKARRAG